MFARSAANRSRSIAIPSGRTTLLRCASAGRRREQIARLPRDASGVWRYHEMLPFDDAAPFVTLFEGNTPFYDAPRSAEYCGLTDLRLKHQGCNPTGSFKDTGMTAAMTQAVILGARTRRLRQHRQHGGEPRRVRGARGIAVRDPCAARASVSARKARAKHGLRRGWSSKSTETLTTACA